MLLSIRTNSRHSQSQTQKSVLLQIETNHLDDLLETVPGEAEISAITAEQTGPQRTGRLFVQSLLWFVSQLLFSGTQQLF